MEEYALLRQAIMKLKPVYQTVITLRFFEDKTIMEISRITGRKEGTVKSQIHRGIGQLRRTLEQKGILSSESRKEQGNG
jgi:RNA polymerase sigma-70 factor (ECF subfamily)